MTLITAASTTNPKITLAITPPFSSEVRRSVHRW